MELANIYWKPVNHPNRLSGHNHCYCTTAWCAHTHTSNKKAWMEKKEVSLGLRQMDIFKIHPRIINTANQSGLESILRRTNDFMNMSCNGVHAKPLYVSSSNLNIQIHQQFFDNFSYECSLLSFFILQILGKNLNEISKFGWNYFQNGFFSVESVIFFA